MWELLFWIIIFIIGYLIIYFSADVFIDNLKELSIFYKISPFIIGLLILGIDPEESIASIIAALNGLPYIALGNIIGNSIISLSLCFSLPALIYEVKFKKIPQFYFWLIYLGSSIILIGFLIYFGLLITGIVALILYCIYLYRNYKYFSNDSTIKLGQELDEIIEEDEKTSKKKMLFLIIISFTLIVIGGELLIYAADEIIQITGISEAFIGFVVIGFLTNVEELTLIIKSIKKSALEIGLGGMIGKIIWNMMFTYGISGIIAMNILFSWNLIWNWIIFLVLILFFNMKAKKESLNRNDGVFLAILFIIFMIINFL